MKPAKNYMCASPPAPTPAFSPHPRVGRHLECVFKRSGHGPAGKTRPSRGETMQDQCQPHRPCSRLVTAARWSEEYPGQGPAMSSRSRRAPQPPPQDTPTRSAGRRCTAGPRQRNRRSRKHSKENLKFYPVVCRYFGPDENFGAEAGFVQDYFIRRHPIAIRPHGRVNTQQCHSKGGSGSSGCWEAASFSVFWPSPALGRRWGRPPLWTMRYARPATAW